MCPGVVGAYVLLGYVCIKAYETRMHQRGVCVCVHVCMCVCVVCTSMHGLNTDTQISSVLMIMPEDKQVHLGRGTAGRGWQRMIM